MTRILLISTHIERYGLNTGEQHMSLTRWVPMDPFAEMEEIMRSLPSVTNNNTLAQRGFIPAVDVYETKDSVIVESQLPGINPEEVEVSVENGVLSIKGEHKREHEVEEKNYYRKEVRSGVFYRQVPLPTEVQENKVSAEFENGILKVTCPKAESVEKKKVNVKITNKNK